MYILLPFPCAVVENSDISSVVPTTPQLSKPVVMLNWLLLPLEQVYEPSIIYQLYIRHTQRTVLSIQGKYWRVRETTGLI